MRKTYQVPETSIILFAPRILADDNDGWIPINTSRTVAPEMGQGNESQTFEDENEPFSPPSLWDE